MVRPRPMVVPVALAGMTAMAGLALGRIYSGPLLAQLVAGAAAGSVLLSAAMRRLPAWTVGPVSVLALAGYILFTVRLSAQRADIPGDLAGVTADALRNGIPRLLTALIPVEPQPDTVVAAVVAGWLAGLAGAELAVRGGRVLLGCAPPALLFAGALVVVGPNAEAAIQPALGFVALAAAGLAASTASAAAAGSAGRTASAGSAGTEASVGSQAGGVAGLDRSARATLRLHGAAGVVVGLVAVVGLTAAVGPLLASRVSVAPADPRRYVTPPQLDALDENPLVRLSGWALNPDQHLFDAELSEDSRIRLAVLTDYDGVTWRVGATYRGAGRSLPVSDEVPPGAEARPGGEAPQSGEEPNGAGTRTEPVTQRITIVELTGHLLPAVGVPRRVDGVRVAYDQASGTLARPEGLTPGLAYAVRSSRTRIDPNLLPSAEVPSGAGIGRLLALGAGVPSELDRLARQLANGNPAAYQRAVAIEAFLAEHYELVADAPSGHAYPNLAFFLFAPRGAGGQRGTSEQFAAAFAVLARLLGLPARVVVGFQARARSGPVRGADALAWPEVLFSGLGWVAFHPLPEPDTQTRPLEEDFRPQPETTTPPPTEAPAPDTSMSAAPPAGPSVAAAPSGRRGPLPLVAGVLAGLMLLAVAGWAFAVPSLRRAQRRHRLDRGPPPDRVAGAWLEVTDALRLAGRAAGTHLAATEVARHAAAAATPHRAGRHPRVRLAAPTLNDLAASVNTAVFGLDAPGEGDARRARAQALAYVAELRAQRPWWRRLLWTVHPGPLRWHRHS